MFAGSGRESLGVGFVAVEMVVAVVFEVYIRWKSLRVRGGEEGGRVWRRGWSFFLARPFLKLVEALRVCLQNELNHEFFSVVCGGFLDGT